MRLLHVTTGELRWFAEDGRPPYAILSHRWYPASDEVDLQELQIINDRQGQPVSDVITSKLGYRKIQNFRIEVTRLGLEWCWMDTGCIDKSSSMELSEAINSMYKWYQGAKVCMVSMPDVPHTDVDPKAPESAFRRSQWFTRGWTLQELIAPRVVLFYNESWACFGDRSVLASLIEEICDVPAALFFDRTPHDYSIAQRMSWAARRVTTRTEDAAYSLLGLFDINMPLLYGEGHNAFQRLQENLMAEPYDLTLLIWGFHLPDKIEIDTAGCVVTGSVLAPSPLSFLGCGDIIQLPNHNVYCREQVEVTTRGLLITVHRLGGDYLGGRRKIICVLPCGRENQTGLLGLQLSMLEYPTRVGDTIEWQSSPIDIMGRIKGCRPVHTSYGWGFHNPLARFRTTLITRQSAQVRALRRPDTRPKYMMIGTQGTIILNSQDGLNIETSIQSRSVEVSRHHLETVVDIGSQARASSEALAKFDIGLTSGYGGNSDAVFSLEIIVDTQPIFQRMLRQLGFNRGALRTRCLLKRPQHGNIPAITLTNNVSINHGSKTISVQRSILCHDPEISIITLFVGRGQYYIRTIGSRYQD